MTTILKIDGNIVPVSATGVLPLTLTLRLGAVSTLTLARRGGALQTLPDPYLGKPVELWIDGLIRFAGDITDADPQYTHLGWVVQYQCRDLRARGDRVPFTDSNTISDAALWNLPSDDPQWMASRAGRTVGEILLDALTMADNAANLNAKGIGGYVSLNPPTLPAATLADLAALTLIPPAPISIGGEKLLGAIESFLSAWAPNHALHVRADGVVRFLDMRATVNKTLTLETDPVEPSPLTRSVGDCFQRVVVRGQPVAEPKLLSMQSGGLEEDFAWGDKTNAQAKADWTPDDFARDEAARSVGTCVCIDTQTVTLTSDPASQTWGANEWDQTQRMGNLYLWDNTIAGVDQYVSRRIVSNTAKTAGNTSTVTLDAALPATSYGNYLLYGVSSGASFVWRKYKISDPAIAAAVARQFTHPVPFVGANGDVAYMTSYPVGSVCWSGGGVGGGPPYGEAPIPFAIDQASGAITFAQPTYVAAGNQPPADVRVLLAINTGSLRVEAPTAGFEGTSHSIDGLSETLTVTVPSWRDPANTSRVIEYAQDLLDSVKDAVIEGSVVYHGLYADALDFGVGISIAGSTYATGWEGLNVPVTEVEVTWNSGSASHHSTSMRCSNRRNHYSSAAFLRPDQAVVALGNAASVAMGNMGNYTPKAYAEREAIENQGATRQRAEPQSLAFTAPFGPPPQTPRSKPYRPRLNKDGMDAAKARRAQNQARLDAHKAAGSELIGPPKPSAVEKMNNRAAIDDRNKKKEEERAKRAATRANRKGRDDE